MKWRSYPGYKPSGVEWLGEVPEHWEPRRLKMSAELKDRKVEADPDDPAPYIGMENIQSWTGRILPIDSEVVPLGTANAFQSKHTLFGKLRPYLAKACNPEFDGLCSTELLVLEPTELERRNLLYCLLSDGFIKLVDSSTFGSKMPRANWSFIGECMIPVPPPDEQRVIADFLDRETARLDTLVGKKRELIEKLKEKRTALISRTVTRGLPAAAAAQAGLNPHPKLKPSGVEWLGDIPEHWEVMPLRYLTRRMGGATPNKAKPEYWEGDIPWVSPKDMKRPHISDAEDHVSIEALENSPLPMIPSKAVLIVVRGMILAHSFPIALTEVPLTINQDMKALIAAERLKPKYLFWSLRGFKKAFVSLADESAHGTRKIETPVIKRFPFLLPSIPEQEAIADYLDRETAKLDRLMEKVEAAVEKLQEYRTALITAAVTGKIDVRKNSLRIR